jgi:hypothetical protein
VFYIGFAREKVKTRLISGLPAGKVLTTRRGLIGPALSINHRHCEGLTYHISFAMPRISVILRIFSYFLPCFLGFFSRTYVEKHIIS